MVYDWVGSESYSGCPDYIILVVVFVGARSDLTVTCLDICPVPVTHITHLEADAIEELVEALLAASNLGWNTPPCWRDSDSSTALIV